MIIGINSKKNCRLGDLNVGQSCKVVKVNIENRMIKCRLLEMGLIKGTVVEVKKIAPMGDPIDLLLRGYELCVRKDELRQIDVEVL